MTPEFDHKTHIFRSEKLKSVVEEAIEFFLQTPVCRLPLPTSFLGGGFYALYYAGDNELYGALSEVNREGWNHPIYVGKAVPPGWRTARAISARTPVLYSRLREHGNNIRQTSDLEIDHFACRFAILDQVEADLVVPVEAELIRRYKPLWNTVVDGFGNHDPGSGRYNQAKSEWDVLHPGRPWAKRLTGQSPRRPAVITKVRESLGRLSPP